MAIRDYKVIQLNRYTAAEWAARNPVLAEGEIGIVTDAVPAKFKIGDGITFWLDLLFQSGSAPGGAYAGKASPSLNPGAQTAKVFYTATTAGTYTNFGGVVLPANSQGFISWTGTQWVIDFFTMNLDSYAKTVDIAAANYLKYSDTKLTKNLANPANITVGVVVNNSNGAIVNDPNSSTILINNIKPSTKYSVRFPDQYAFIRINQYLTSNDAYLGPSLENATGQVTFTTGSATDRLRISYPNVPTGYLNRIMVNEGDFATYTPYGDIEISDKKSISTAINQRTGKANLFDNAKRYLGQFINSAGVIQTGLSTAYSRFNIPNIKANTLYEYLGDAANDRRTVAKTAADNSANQTSVIIVFRNDAGANLGVWTKYNGIFAAYTSFPITFTTPAGTTNIDVTGWQDGIDQTSSFLLKEGDELTKLRMQTSTFAGKMVVYLGDSVTFLNRHQPFIGEKLGNHWVNVGVPGALTIPGYENIEGDGVRRASTAERVELLAQFNPDVIVVQTGFNDPRPNIPIGTISDEITPTFDTNGRIVASSVVGATFYGSLKYVLRRAIQLNPLARVLMVNSHFTTAGGAAAGGRDAISNAILQVCKLYRIPCLDQYNNSGINQFNIGTYTADTLHLNEEGGKLYSERMAAFINGHFSES